MFFEAINPSYQEIPFADDAPELSVGHDSHHADDEDSDELVKAIQKYGFHPHGVTLGREYQDDNDLIIGSYDQEHSFFGDDSLENEEQRLNKDIQAFEAMGYSFKNEYEDEDEEFFRRYYEPGPDILADSSDDEMDGDDTGDSNAVQSIVPSITVSALGTQESNVDSNTQGGDMSTVTLTEEQASADFKAVVEKEVVRAASLYALEQEGIRLRGGPLGITNLENLSARERQQHQQRKEMLSFFQDGEAYMMKKLMKPQPMPLVGDSFLGLNIYSIFSLSNYQLIYTNACALQDELMSSSQTLSQTDSSTQQTHTTAGESSIILPHQRENQSSSLTMIEDTNNQSNHDDNMNDKSITTTRVHHQQTSLSVPKKLNIPPILEDQESINRYYYHSTQHPTDAVVYTTNSASLLAAILSIPHYYVNTVSMIHSQSQLDRIATDYDHQLYPDIFPMTATTSPSTSGIKPPFQSPTLSSQLSSQLLMKQIQLLGILPKHLTIFNICDTFIRIHDGLYYSLVQTVSLSPSSSSSLSSSSYQHPSLSIRNDIDYAQYAQLQRSRSSKQQQSQQKRHTLAREMLKDICYYNYCKQYHSIMMNNSDHHQDLPSICDVDQFILLEKTYQECLDICVYIQLLWTEHQEQTVFTESQIKNADDVFQAPHATPSSHPQRVLDSLITHTLSGQNQSNNLGGANDDIDQAANEYHFNSKGFVPPLPLWMYAITPMTIEFMVTLFILYDSFAIHHFNKVFSSQETIQPKPSRPSSPQSAEPETPTGAAMSSDEMYTDADIDIDIDGIISKAKMAPYTYINMTTPTPPKNSSMQSYETDMEQYRAHMILLSCIMCIKDNIYYYILENDDSIDDASPSPPNQNDLEPTMVSSTDHKDEHDMFLEMPLLLTSDFINTHVKCMKQLQDATRIVLPLLFSTQYIRFPFLAVLLLQDDDDNGGINSLINANSSSSSSSSSSSPSSNSRTQHSFIGDDWSRLCITDDLYHYYNALQRISHHTSLGYDEAIRPALTRFHQQYPQYDNIITLLLQNTDSPHLQQTYDDRIQSTSSYYHHLMTTIQHYISQLHRQYTQHPPAMLPLPDSSMSSPNLIEAQLSQATSGGAQTVLSASLYKSYITNNMVHVLHQGKGPSSSTAGGDDTKQNAWSDPHYINTIDQLQDAYQQTVNDTTIAHHRHLAAFYRSKLLLGGLASGKLSLIVTTCHAVQQYSFPFVPKIHHMPVNYAEYVNGVTYRLIELRKRLQSQLELIYKMQMKQYKANQRIVHQLLREQQQLALQQSQQQDEQNRQAAAKHLDPVQQYLLDYDSKNNGVQQDTSALNETETRMVATSNPPSTITDTTTPHIDDGDEYDHDNDDDDDDDEDDDITTSDHYKAQQEYFKLQAEYLTDVSLPRDDFSSMNLEDIYRLCVEGRKQYHASLDRQRHALKAQLQQHSGEGDSSEFTFPEHVQNNLLLFPNEQVDGTYERLYKSEVRRLRKERREKRHAKKAKQLAKRHREEQRLQYLSTTKMRIQSNHPHARRHQRRQERIAQALANGETGIDSSDGEDNDIDGDGTGNQDPHVLESEHEDEGRLLIDQLGLDSIEGNLNDDLNSDSDDYNDDDDDSDDDFNDISSDDSFEYSDDHDDGRDPDLQHIKRQLEQEFNKKKELLNTTSFGDVQRLPVSLDLLPTGSNSSITEGRHPSNPVDIGKNPFSDNTTLTTPTLQSQSSSWSTATTDQENARQRALEYERKQAEFLGYTLFTDDERVFYDDFSTISRSGLFILQYVQNIPLVFDLLYPLTRYQPDYSQAMSFRNEHSLLSGSSQPQGGLNPSAGESSMKPPIDLFQTLANAAAQQDSESEQGRSINIHHLSSPSVVKTPSISFPNDHINMNTQHVNLTDKTIRLFQSFA